MGRPCKPIPKDALNEAYWTKNMSTTEISAKRFTLP